MQAYLVTKDDAIVNIIMFDEADIPTDDGFKYILCPKDENGFNIVFNIGDIFNV